MEGKLITTKGLEAYTRQLKTFIGDTYQTKADMTSYKKTAELYDYLDDRYIAKNSSIYCNPIYKHTVTVVYSQFSRIDLTIFTTRAERYETAAQFRTDWVENRKIISVLADASSTTATPGTPATVFKGTVIGVIAASDGIAVRISGIQADSIASKWDQIYTLTKWSYLGNPSRI